MLQSLLTKSHGSSMDSVRWARGAGRKVWEATLDKLGDHTMSFWKPMMSEPAQSLPSSRLIAIWSSHPFQGAQPAFIQHPQPMRFMATIRWNRSNSHSFTMIIKGVCGGFCDRLWLEAGTNKAAASDSMACRISAIDEELNMVRCDRVASKRTFQPKRND